MPDAEAGLVSAVRDEDLDLLRDAARDAGSIALGYFRNKQEVWMKEGLSPVSEADFAVDKFLRETLLSARPDYGWLSEETVDSPDRLGARRTFVVDPIDGTRGFLEGLDYWCVSIAVVEAGQPRCGVLECPARGETFWAQAGGGAWRNGKPIETRPLGDRVRISGPRPMIDGLPAEWLTAVDRGMHIPSLAYRVAMIANSDLDATFVKPNAHDWDLAAADLILHEAGGRLINAAGGRPAYAGPTVIHGALAAGSGRLIEAMAKVIAGQRVR